MCVIPWQHNIRSKREHQLAVDKADHARQNARKAARCVRQYAKANNLNRLWTLTYRDAAADRAQVANDVYLFRKRLYRRYGNMPSVCVIERGRRNTRRLHVHMALPRWIPANGVRRLWGHGNVDVGDGGKYRGIVGSRTLAGYLAKYILKGFGLADDDQMAANDPPIVEERLPGQHRYQLARGWQPECKRRRFFDIPQALAWLEAYYGTAEWSGAWSLPALPDVHGVFLLYGDDAVRHWLSPPASSSASSASSAWPTS